MARARWCARSPASIPTASKRRNAAASPSISALRIWSCPRLTAATVCASASSMSPATSALCATCWPASAASTWSFSWSPPMNPSSRRPASTSTSAACSTSAAASPFSPKPIWSMPTRSKSCASKWKSFCAVPFSIPQPRRSSPSAPPPAPDSNGSGKSWRSLPTAHRRAIRRAALRLPIDRVFTIKGFGTVVTGTLISGTVRKEEEVEVLPGARRVRVRGIQNHNQPAEHAIAGQRTALNLAAISPEELARGMMLVPAGLFRAGQRLDVEINLLASARPLKDRARVHLHAYTAETVAEVVLIGQSPRQARGYACRAERSCARRKRAGSTAPRRTGGAASVRPLHPAPVFPGGHHRRRLRARRRSAGAPHQCRRTRGIPAQPAKSFSARTAGRTHPAAPGPWIVARRCRGRNRLAARAARAAGRGPRRSQTSRPTRRNRSSPPIHSRARAPSC